MERGKRERLERAGWKVGSAKEFLGLSDEEDEFIAMKLALAEGLRRRRIHRRLTQQQVAAMLGSSQSRVAKMEAGDPSVSLDLLMQALLTMGVTRRAVAKLIAPPRESRAA